MKNPYTLSMYGIDEPLLSAIFSNVKVATFPLPPGGGSVAIGDLGQWKLQQGLVSELSGARFPSFLGLPRLGADAFERLVSIVKNSSPLLKRGTTRKSLDQLLRRVIGEQFVVSGRPNASAYDVAAIIAAVDDWVAEEMITRTHFIPCAVSPHAQQPFMIGPVSFHELTTKLQSLSHHFRGLDQTNDHMRDTAIARGGKWLAEIEVADCESAQSEYFANTAVDLATTGVQMLFHFKHVQNIGRITGRAPPIMFGTCWISPTGKVGQGIRNDFPGLTLGVGAINSEISKNQQLVDAIGHRINAFLAQSSHNSQIAAVELAWCDAAYWFREGLAEPVDTIAVAKLETCLEVLLGAESSSGSRRRIEQAFKLFLGKAPQDRIFTSTHITVKKFAQELVGARSRVLHGTSSTLVDDGSGTPRDEAWIVVHAMLILSALKLDQFVASGAAIQPPAAGRAAFDSFLAWVEQNP